MPIVQLTTEQTELAAGDARTVWVRNLGKHRVTIRNGGDQIALRTGRDHLFRVTGPLTACVTEPDGAAGEIEVDVA